MNGTGLYTFKDGSTYEGEFKDDLKSGFGKRNYMNGDVYEGEWKKDKINGLNDISFENAQVAMEFGRREETKNVYTYGLERLSAQRVDDTVDTYLYDGRGSVAQVVDWQTPGAQGLGNAITSGGIANTQVTIGAAVGAQTSGENDYTIQNLFYDPYGEVKSGANENDLIFGYNAEEYNPVVDLQYLRARYYAPEVGVFITEDSALGELTNITSQNRYTYAENDPVNNADPSGYAIGNSVYERQMEAAGGINEIYNFYMGQTLQNTKNSADSAFYRQYAAATNVPYTNLAAINNISQIPQSLANYSINQGANAAYAIGAVYGCTPGTLTNQAVAQFTNDVNASKDSVNTQIAVVKNDKLQENAAWQEAQKPVAGKPIGALPVRRPGVGGYDPGTYKKEGFIDWITDQAFEWDDRQNIWYGDLNAWQRLFGYNNFYDLLFDIGELITNIFPSVNVSSMNFISYFDDGKGLKWRIEGWKGNYLTMGVGAEIGAYFTLSILGGHYFAPIDTAKAKDYLPIMQFTLNNNNASLFSRGPERHWWLSGFKPGIGTINKKNLKMVARITFDSKWMTPKENANMANKFVEKFSAPKATIKNVNASGQKVSIVWQ
jgi:RHS repeat-associated protein